MTLEIRATLKNDLCSARECFKLLYRDERFLFNCFQGLCDLVLMIQKTWMVQPNVKETFVAKSSEKQMF